MASAARYVERAAERNRKSADRTRPKQHLRAFIDYPEIYMGLHPEQLFQKTSIVKNAFSSAVSALTTSKVEVGYIQAKSAEYGTPYNSAVAFVRFDPPLSDTALSRLDWGAAKFLDDGSSGQMAKVRFSKQTYASFGLSPCCSRTIECCSQSKAQAVNGKCNGRDLAYNMRRAKAAAQREKNYNDRNQAFAEERTQREAAKRKRLEEAQSKVRATPCKRFWAGKCTRVYGKCVRTHGSMDEAAAIICASCPGPNFEEGWECPYSAKNETCPYLHC